MQICSHFQLHIDWLRICTSYETKGTQTPHPSGFIINISNLFTLYVIMSSTTPVLFLLVSWFNGTNLIGTSSNIRDMRILVPRRTAKFSWCFSGKWTAILAALSCIKKYWPPSSSLRKQWAAHKSSRFRYYLICGSGFLNWTSWTRIWGSCSWN